LRTHLKDGKVSGDMRRLLEIRKALSKTSTKKYQSFLNRSGDDHRVRDILLYHGASTGRDTGTGIQPHNFPRGAIKVDRNRPYAAVENVIECEPETLKLLYGESLPILFSSVLRNMIVPSKGCELFVADFSKIEVAVLWWLAGNEPGLKILTSGKDPYKYMAAANTGQAYEDIPDDGDDRQLR
jgi:DNA polymerase